MAIGFEFQANWNVKKELVSGNPTSRQNFPKETAMFGQRQPIPGWCMETDGDEIEFVIEPPIAEGPVGRSKLDQVLTSIINHIRMMEGYKCEMRRRTHPQIFGFSAPEQAVIYPQGRNFSTTKGQAHITVGVRLGRIQKMVAEMARIGLQPANPNALFDRDGSHFYTDEYDRAARLAAAAQPLTIGGSALIWLR